MKELAPLTSSLSAVQTLIELFDNQGIFIGGVAVALLGEPRFTADTDAMMLIPMENIPDLIAQAKNLGLIPRLPDAANFAQKSRVVLLQHEETSIDVDIALGLLPFEIEAVERSQLLPIGDLTLRLPTPEDLIILKAIANRPKDKLDLKSIIESSKSLDKNRIEFWVSQFADLLESPEIWLEVESLLDS